MSGYYAINSLEGIIECTAEEKRDYVGFGFTGQIKPSICIDIVPLRPIVGFNFVYDKEFGNYLTFRNSFDTLNKNPSLSVKRYDVSPRGQTFSWTVNGGAAYVIDGNNAITAELSGGFCYPDFLWDKYMMIVWGGMISYTGEKFWSWAAVEYLPFLNMAISLGAGFRIR